MSGEELTMIFGEMAPKDWGEGFFTTRLLFVQWGRGISYPNIAGFVVLCIVTLSIARTKVYMRAKHSF